MFKYTYLVLLLGVVRISETGFPVQFIRISDRRHLHVPKYPTTGSDCSCRIYDLPSMPCADQFKYENYNLSFTDISQYHKYQYHEIVADSILFILTYGNCTTVGHKIVKVIDTCPYSDRGNQLRTRCHDAGSHLPLVEYNNHVRILFKNIHCARCHNATVGNYLSVLNYRVKCNGSKQSNLMWKDLREKVISKECYMKFAILQTMYLCDREDNMANIAAKQCHLCLSIEGDDQTQLFSNASCVICKVILDVTRGGCTPGSDPTNSLIGLFQSPIKPVHKIAINNQIFKVNNLCPGNSRFDTFFSMCRPFSCSKDKIPKNGRCVPSSFLYPSTEDQPFPNGSKYIYTSITVYNAFSFMDMFRKTFVGCIKEELSWDFGSAKRFVLANISLSKVISRLSAMQFHVLDAALMYIEMSLDNTLNEFNNCSIECFNSCKIHYLNEDMFFGIPTNNHTLMYPVDKVLYTINANTSTATIGKYSGEHMLHKRFADNSKENGNEFSKITSNHVKTLGENEVGNYMSRRKKRSIYKERTRAGSITLDATDVCICKTPPITFDVEDQASRKSRINCSLELYQYQASEYSLTNDGNLQIRGFSVQSSRFHIGQNSIAFVCFEDQEPAKEFFKLSTNQLYLSWTCTGISSFCLVLTILIYFLLPELQTLPRRLMVALCLYLLIAQCLLLVPEFFPGICIYLAALSHFSWLSVFAWMNASAIHMFFTFGTYFTRLNPKRWFNRYLCGCTIFPSLIVIICLTLDLLPSSPIRVKYGQGSCNWISDLNGLIYFFFVPVAISLLFNFGFFCSALRYIQTTTQATAQGNERNLCIIYLKMSSLMGFTWVFGFVAFLADLSALWYVYLLLNGLQGFFIFVSFNFNVRTGSLLRSKLNIASLTNSFQSAERNQHRVHVIR